MRILKIPKFGRSCGVSNDFFCNTSLLEKPTLLLLCFFLGGGGWSVVEDNGKQSQEVRRYCSSNTLCLLNMEFEQLSFVIYERAIYDDVMEL